MIEYWQVSDHQFPEQAVSFKYKMETDLFALAKAKTHASSLAVSQDGTQFAVFCADKYAPDDTVHEGIKRPSAVTILNGHPRLSWKPSMMLDLVEMEKRVGACLACMMPLHTLSCRIPPYSSEYFVRSPA